MAVPSPNLHDLQVYGIVVTIILCFIVFGGVKMIMGQFFDTRTDSPFSRYSPVFYHFLVLTQIRPFSGNRGDSFSILVPILAFPGARSDSTFFCYSRRFGHFSVIAGTVFRYSYRF